MKLTARSGDRGAATGGRRWAALVFIATAQLMIALDATIVNIALPTAQRSLHIDAADRQWAITAYTLAFGGLLLIGGRVADLAGRRRTFLAALIGFAAASAFGGAATGLGTLIAARALQGAFGAVLAPTTLSLLATAFTEARERAKAFAIYGAIAGSGGATGLILGGVLAEHLGWRWCLYVNAPIAVVAAIGAWRTLTPAPSTPAPNRPRLDVPGALLVTGGLVALVYGCGRAATSGWASATVVGPLAGGVILLAAFAVVQVRSAAPLLPPRILRDRNRVGAYAAVAFAVAGMYGLFIFLTYYLQIVLRYPPVSAGLAFLPMSAAVLIGSGLVANRLLTRVPTRLLIAPGLLLAAAAMLLLTRLTPEGGYAAHVLPAEIMLGLGMGCVFTPAFHLATQAVQPRDAGVASAVVTTSQQVGGSIGTALLNTVAAGATAAYALAHPGGPAQYGLVHGYATAAAYGAALFTAGAVIAAVLITANPRRSDHAHRPQ
ncbi:MAG TPA: MFS transporter [Streptosporangiaceae bacterium]|jgi:EmrB/QacA subfamily drug resistance transporter